MTKLTIWQKIAFIASILILLTVTWLIWTLWNSPTDPTVKNVLYFLIFAQKIQGDQAIRNWLKEKEGKDSNLTELAEEFFNVQKETPQN